LEFFIFNTEFMTPLVFILYFQISLHGAPDSATQIVGPHEEVATRTPPVAVPPGTRRNGYTPEVLVASAPVAVISLKVTWSVVLRFCPISKAPCPVSIEAQERAPLKLPVFADTVPLKYRLRNFIVEVPISLPVVMGMIEEVRIASVWPVIDTDDTSEV
jgi:hypothetical protein